MALFQKHGQQNPLNKDYQFWQNESHPVVLNHPLVLQQKMDYIHQNPVRAGFVDEAHCYCYSSANPLSPVRVDTV